MHVIIQIYQNVTIFNLNYKTMKSNDFSLFRLLLAFFCIAGMALPSFGQLSGAYTINPTLAASATNYQSFHSAITDLDSGKRYDGGTANGSGVKGRVVFNIAAGSYEERLNITYISGSSATNTITFQSDSKDSTKVLLYYPSSYSTKGNYTLQLDSAAFISFRHITIERTGTYPNAQVVNMLDLLTDDSFSGCRVLGVNGTTSNLAPNIVIALNNSLDNGVCFNGNLIRYGYTGFSCTASIQNINLSLTGNQFDSAAYNLLFISDVASLILRNNVLNGPAGISINTIYTALYNNVINTAGEFNVSPQTYILVGNTMHLGRSSSPSYDLNYVDYEKNIIYGDISIDLFGGGLPNSPPDYINIEKNVIYGGVSVNLESGKCQITNNFIDQSLSLNNEGTANFSAYFNNILSANGSVSVSMSMRTGGSIVLKNNNIVNYYTGSGSTEGAVLYVSSYSDFPTHSDYNNYYSADTTPFEIGTYQLNLSNYQAASGMDSNSTFIDPEFVSDSNLHSANTKLAGKGTYINGIPDDIDGNLRPKHPTIGANELDDSLHFITAYFQPNDSYNIAYPVQFKDASQSNHCGKINKWLWRFGDGTADTAENPSHIYAFAGSYIVKLTVQSSAGCIDSFNIVIKIYGAFITALFTNNSDSNGVGSFIEFENNSTSTNCGTIDKWLWEFGDGTTDSFPGGTAHEYKYTGSYTVKLIIHSSLGCVDSFSEVVVIKGDKPYTSVKLGTSSEQSVKIYPNPFTSIFTIETGNTVVKSMQLMDITGRDVTGAINISEKPLQIDASNLPSGIYFIRLNFENGNYVAKVVKE